MAQTHINGVDIAWQQLGEGPDLVFVHGLAANRAFWVQHYALPLSQHFPSPCSICAATATAAGRNPATIQSRSPLIFPV